VGICAGAVLASCRQGSSLNLINVTPLIRRVEVRDPDGVRLIQMPDRGFGVLKVELTDAGSKILGKQTGHLNILYSVGPVFHPAGRNDLPACVSLAVYRTEIGKHGGTMVGTPAILAASFGKGRVIIFSPHPEASGPDVTPGLESIVARAVLATARKLR
jgi:hypothetical protein